MKRASTRPGEIEDIMVAYKAWDADLMRACFSKDEVMCILMMEYDADIPWELDDALYYAQTAYPEISAEDLLKTWHFLQSLELV